MCTLIVLHRCVPGAPLVIGANRDEYFNRPSQGPAVRRMPEGVVLAPLDDREGGTWLGLNGNGVFAALTNRSTQESDPSGRSRGLLVMDALAAKTTEGAVERIRTLTAMPANRAGAKGSSFNWEEVGGLVPGVHEVSHSYNPFNMVVADRERAFAITYADESEVFPLEPGVHVIGNLSLGDTSSKLDRIARGARRAATGRSEDVVDSLAEVCRDHEGDSFDAACVHGEQYGTRSSVLLRLGEASPEDRAAAYGPESSFHYADGVPCRNPYLDFTPLLRELDREARIVEGESTARSER